MINQELDVVGQDVISLQDVAAHVNNVNFDEEVVVFDSFTEINRPKELPFQVDALIIVLCTRGGGRIGIDLREYDIKENSLIVIEPQNYIFLVDLNPDFTASVVACSRRVVEEVLPKLTDMLPLIMQNRAEPVSNLSPDEADSLACFYSLIKNKLSQPSSLFLKNMVNCLLQAALYELMNIRASKDRLATPQQNRKQEIMARFILAVCDNFRTKRQVAFYADLLCITPKHLSAVVKSVSGRTAGDWIENYVTMEAKVLLRSTDLTIQEISSKLNFANQSFFGKYFKHQTGLSPSEFRRGGS